MRLQAGLSFSSLQGLDGMRPDPDQQIRAEPRRPLPNLP